MARLSGLVLALGAGLLLPLGLAPFDFAWAPLLGLGLIFARIATRPGAVAVLAEGYVFDLFLVVIEFF